MEKTIEYKSYERLPECVARCFPCLFGETFDECNSDLGDFMIAMFADGKPVACVFGCVETFRIGKDGRIESRVLVHKMEVAPKEHGKGYGSILYMHVVDLYNPYEAIICPIEEAVGFWKGIGFRRISGTEFMKMKFKH